MVRMSKDQKSERLEQITVKVRKEDLNRLRKYADKKGGNPYSHYIREAIVEYLENHEK